MKNQALFSSKDKDKIFKCRLLQFLFGASAGPRSAVGKVPPSWKIVVSEWRSVIAVSLNVGGGVHLIKPAKLCMCAQNTTNTTRTDARRRMCAAMFPYR